MAKSNFILMGILVFIIIVLFSILCWYGIMFYKLKTSEGFANPGVVSLSNNVENECPLSAERQLDGRILVQPQNRSFDSMGDYTAWISSTIAAGSMCAPPFVNGPREVVVTSNRDTGPNKEVIKEMNNSRNVFTKQVEGEMTYAKTDIKKLDDYEYTRIFQNENSPRGNISKTAVNSMMASHQWDWAKLPYNSEARAAKENSFIAGREDSAIRDPKTGVFFKTLEGFEVNPPDTAAINENEKKSLATYTETPAENLLKHNVQDVAELVKKMYADDPDWEPVVERVNDNEFRVSELRPKRRVEYYAGEEEQTIERAKEGGNVSAGVTVEGGRQDPFFDKKGVLDYSNDRFWEYKDFKQWTPGLERMFAPTLDTTNWS
jgi:hypothetical protein